MTKHEFQGLAKNFAIHLEEQAFYGAAGDGRQPIASMPAVIAPHDKQLSIEVQAWVSAGEIVAKSIRSRMEGK